MKRVDLKASVLAVLLMGLCGSCSVINSAKAGMVALPCRLSTLLEGGAYVESNEVRYDQFSINTEVSTVPAHLIVVSETARSNDSGLQFTPESEAMRATAHSGDLTLIASFNAVPIRDNVTFVKATANLTGIAEPTSGVTASFQFWGPIDEGPISSPPLGVAAVDITSFAEHTPIDQFDFPRGIPLRLIDMRFTAYAVDGEGVAELSSVDFHLTTSVPEPPAFSLMGISVAFIAAASMSRSHPRGITLKTKGHHD